MIQKQLNSLGLPILLIVFFVSLFLIRLITFRDIYLEVSEFPAEFNLRNFFLFNYFIHAFPVAVGIFLLVLVYKFIYYSISDIQVSFNETMKAVLLVKIVLLIDPIIKMVYFLANLDLLTNERFLNFERIYSINIFLDNPTSILDKYLSYFDFFFFLSVVILASLFVPITKLSFSTNLKLVLLTDLVIGILSVYISSSIWSSFS